MRFQVLVYACHLFCSTIYDHVHKAVGKNQWMGEMRVDLQLNLDSYIKIK